MTVSTLFPDTGIPPHPSQATSKEFPVDIDVQKNHNVSTVSTVEDDAEDHLHSQFKGWMGLDEKSVDGALKHQSFQPKKREETDVDIRITHCGLCGSDLHVLRSGWVARQKADTYPTLRC